MRLMKRSIAALLVLLVLMPFAFQVSAEDEFAPDAQEIPITWLDGNVSLYGMLETVYIPEMNWLFMCPMGCDGYMFDLNTNRLLDGFVDAGSFSEGLLPVKMLCENGKDYKWGFVDASGKTVIKPEYDGAGIFSEGLASVKQYDENGDPIFGYIDKSGKLVLPFENYNSASQFSHGLALIQKRNEAGELKYGYIDKTGALVVPPQFDEADTLNEFGCAWVYNKAKNSGDIKLGMMGSDGKLVLPLEYDSSSFDFTDGYAYIAKDGKFGYVGPDGKLITELKYDYDEDVRSEIKYIDGRGLVTKLDSNGERKFGFIDEHGNEVIPLEYDDAMAFKYGTGYAMVGIRDESGTIKYGAIDRNGRKVIPMKYDSAEMFGDNGLAAIGQKTADGSLEYGYAPMDGSDKIAVPSRFESAYAFSDGLALVRVKSEDGSLKWGYIDSSGEYVIEPKYYMAGSFVEGVARVQLMNDDGSLETCFIDRTGRVLVRSGKYTFGTTMYDYSADCGLELISCGSDEHGTAFGYVGRDGKWMIPPQYDSAGQIDGTKELYRLYYVEKDGRIGIFENPYYKLMEEYRNSQQTTYNISSNEAPEAETDAPEAETDVPAETSPAEAQNTATAEPTAPAADAAGKTKQPSTWTWIAICFAAATVCVLAVLAVRKKKK